jgi:hypothetical protein
MIANGVFMSFCQKYEIARGMLEIISRVAPTSDLHMGFMVIMMSQLCGAGHGS